MNELFTTKAHGDAQDELFPMLDDEIAETSGDTTADELFGLSVKKKPNAAASPSLHIQAARQNWRTQSSNTYSEIREPFAGAGAVSLTALASGAIGKVWLNELETGMCALWLAIQQYPRELKDAVRAVVPSVGEFVRWKEYFLLQPQMPLDAATLVEMACGRLALQRLSFGALGPMAGAPRGGWQQLKGGITSRWNSQTICKMIDEVSPLLASAKVTNHDFEAVISDESTRAAIYCDPPYVAAGPKLYLHSFSEADHDRLSDLLRSTPHRWALSYDDHPLVRSLYSDFANITTIGTRYCGVRKTQVEELLISRR